MSVALDTPATTLRDATPPPPSPHPPSTPLIHLSLECLPKQSIFVGALLMFRDKLPPESSAYHKLVYYAECFAHSDLLSFGYAIPEALKSHAMDHPPHYLHSQGQDPYGAFLVYRAFWRQMEVLQPPTSDETGVPPDVLIQWADQLKQEALKWYCRSIMMTVDVPLTPLDLGGGGAGSGANGDGTVSRGGNISRSSNNRRAANGQHASAYRSAYGAGGNVPHNGNAPRESAHDSVRGNTQQGNNGYPNGFTNNVGLPPGLFLDGEEKQVGEEEVQ